MAQITSFTVKTVTQQGSLVVVSVQFSTGDTVTMSFDGDATSNYMTTMFKKEAAARNRADALNASLQSAINTVITVP